MSHAPPDNVIGGPAQAPFELSARSFVTSGLDTAPRPVSLLTADGIALAALHWPTSSTPPVAVVVLVHGLAARKDHPHIQALAERLQGNGFEVLSYDARGHGASAGIFTLGHREHLDVESAAAWARERGVPTILVGASLGGVATLRYACDHPELAGVVVVSSPAGWRIPLRARALLSVGLARTRPGRWVARRRMGVRISAGWTASDPPQVLTDRVASPLAVVHGQRDALIPVRWGLESHLRADPRRYVVLARDMGHAFDPKGHDAICSAVDWTLVQER
jgi:pimeloyl-ACP methyl ester carboxylesterase